MKAVETIAVVVLGGVVTAIVLFVVTSQTPVRTYLGPGVGSQVVAMPGFDPWTGEPRGMIYDFTPLNGPATTTRITAEREDDMIDRRAVPVPVGFALGAFIMLVWLRSDLCRGSFPARRH